MKKVLVSVLALAVVLGSACSLNSGPSATDASDSVTESTKIEFDYPDQLKFIDAGLFIMPALMEKRGGSSYTENRRLSLGTVNLST